MGHRQKPVTTCAPPALSSRRGVRILGAAGSLLLHTGVLLMAGVYYPGTDSSPILNPQETPVAKSGGALASELSPMTVMFLDPPRETAVGTQEVRTIALSPVDLAVIAGQPDPIQLSLQQIQTPADDEPPEPAKETATAESSAHERLFGRYVGQITARIERTWIKPRAPIESGTFVCHVQVLQDAAGNVLAVTPQRCNGSQRWQQSLAQAIFGASPLPAPPDRQVFTSTLTLFFTSDEYVPGRSTEGFESEALAMSHATSDESASHLQDFIDRARTKTPREPGVIDLRITGSRRSVDGPVTAETTAQTPQSASGADIGQP